MPFLPISPEIKYFIFTAFKPADVSMAGLVGWSHTGPFAADKALELAEKLRLTDPKCESALVFSVDQIKARIAAIAPATDGADNNPRAWTYPLVLSMQALCDAYMMLPTPEPPQSVHAIPERRVELQPTGTPANQDLLPGWSVESLAHPADMSSEEVLTVYFDDVGGRDEVGAGTRERPFFSVMAAVTALRGRNAMIRHVNGTLFLDLRPAAMPGRIDVSLPAWPVAEDPNPVIGGGN